MHESTGAIGNRRARRVRGELQDAPSFALRDLCGLCGEYATAVLGSFDNLECDVVLKWRQRDRQLAVRRLGGLLRQRLPFPGIERPDGVVAVVQAADREGHAAASF